MAIKLIFTNHWQGNCVLNVEVSRIGYWQTKKEITYKKCIAVNLPIIFSTMPTIRSCNSPALLIVCLLIFCTLYYKSKVEIGFTEHSSPLRRFDQPTGTWPFQVLKKNDSFEVLLFYSVKSKHVPRLTVPENQVLQNGTSKKNLSFDDLVKIPDSYWKLPIHIDVTRTYPQAIDVVDATNRLMNGDPLYEVSV